MIITTIKLIIMKLQKPKIEGTKVTFGPCRLSYASLLTRNKFDGDPGEGKYMTNVLIPKSATETINALKQAIEAAKSNGLASRWGGKLPRNFRVAFYDGDEKEDEVYHGHHYINPKSNMRPAVVDRNFSPLTEEEDVYSGMWAMVSVDFFPYATGGNGVGCALLRVLKVKDDERLGGGVKGSVESDFAGYSFDDDLDDDEL